MKKKEPKNTSEIKLCTSIFKDGRSTSKKIYTEKWVELINILEKRGVSK